MGKSVFSFALIQRPVIGVKCLNHFLQVEKLEKEIEVKNREKEALEARTNEAEKKVLQFNSELEKVSFMKFSMLLWL